MSLSFSWSYPTTQFTCSQLRSFVHAIGDASTLIYQQKKKYGKRLVSIDTTSGPGVTATFQDGTTHTATVLVGAEGAHSPVREHLLGPDKGALLNSGIVLSILQSKLPVDRALALRALHHRIACAFHPSGMFMWFGGKAGRQPF